MVDLMFWIVLPQALHFSSPEETTNDSPLYSEIRCCSETPVSRRLCLPATAILRSAGRFDGITRSRSIDASSGADWTEVADAAGEGLRAADALAILNIVANALELHPEPAPLHALLGVVSSPQKPVALSATSPRAGVAAAAPDEDGSDILKSANFC